MKWWPVVLVLRWSEEGMGSVDRFWQYVVLNSRFE
jgi:hypothetical protein